MKHLHTRRWGENESGKKARSLFLLPSFRFLFALETFCFFFFEEKLNALVFFSLWHVSLVCFLKKWPKIDLCFGLFFCTPEKANERFLPRNHSQTTSSFLYLFINSFTHNNTYYKTTRIKIHHSERRRKKTQTRSCLLLLYLSQTRAVIVWTQKSARSFLFLKATFIESSFCPLWII